MSTIEKFSEDTEVLDQADICVFPSSISMWSYEQVGWQINITVGPGKVSTVEIIIPTVSRGMVHLRFGYA